MPKPKKQSRERPLPEIPDYAFPADGLIGEGTFGEVWVGIYKGDQYRAVKVFKPEMIRDDLWRSEYEKLKALDEPPGIVTLYDQGETTDGRPFVAMRLMADENPESGWKGRTLSSRIEADDLNESDRWRLIFEIADVLAYMHRQGVFHCDVKPGNVLLTAGDESRPVLCDFGQSIGEGYTPESASGTFLFASPEQLRRDDKSIASWDVYSFGVTAWLLLTGKLPRLSKIAEDLKVEDAATVLQRTFDSMSLVSSSLGHSLDRELIPKMMIEAIEAERDLSVPSSLVESPRRAEIDVLIRCLALDGDQPNRFENMSEVVAAFEKVDQDRAIAGERRKKILFATLTVFGLLTTLVAGWQWSRAESSRKTAEEFGQLAAESAKVQTRLAEEAAVQRDEARKQTKIADAEKVKAINSEETATVARATAEKLINTMLYDLKNQLEPLGRTDLLDKVSSEAAAYFASLPEDQRNDASERERSTMLNNRGEVFLSKGELDQANAAFEEAYEIRSKLLEVSPADPQRLRDVSICLERLGDTLTLQGELAGAEERYRKCLEIRRQIPDATTNARTQWDIGIALNKLSGLRVLENDIEEASRLTDESLVLLSAAAEADPNDETIQRDFAAVQMQCGDLYRLNGEIELAKAEYQKAALIFDALFSKANADDVSIRKDQSAIRIRQGEIDAQVGNVKSALAHFEYALPLMREVLLINPSDPNSQRNLGLLLSQLGQIHLDNGEFEIAAQHLRESVSIFESLASLPEVEPEWLGDLQATRINYGDTFAQKGDSGEAAVLYRQSLDTGRKRMAMKGGDRSEVSQDLVVSLYKTATSIKSTDSELAEKQLVEALSLLSKPGSPESAEWSEVIRGELESLRADRQN